MIDLGYPGVDLRGLVRACSRLACQSQNLEPRYLVQVVSCRTTPTVNEVIYVGLAVFLLLVGIAVGVTALALGPWPVAAFAVLFVSLGLWNFRLMLFRRGSRLSFDPASRAVRWKAPLAQREMQADRIVRIARVRPAVFALQRDEGPNLEFWLTSTDRSVRTFFDQLLRANQAIDGSDLYKRAWPWWRGLPHTV